MNLSDVGLRLVGDGQQATGPGLGPDVAGIAARLAAQRLVDFLHVGIGVSGVGMVRPMYALLLERARRLGGKISLAATPR